MLLSGAIVDRLLGSQKPKADRGSSRLLVLHKDTGDVEHAMFADIGKYISGDLWVNESALDRCRMSANRKNRRDWIIFAKKIGDRRWRVCQEDGEPDFKTGETFDLADGTVCYVMGTTGYWAEVSVDRTPEWAIWGTVPLLSGVERPTDETDVSAYEAPWARIHGSKTLATAGVHFTNDTLKGFTLKPICLHIVYNSLSVIREEEVDEHDLPAEEYSINTPPPEGMRVTAVGTTVARALETWAATGSKSGWTNLFIKPPYEFKAVESLVTNFHMPGDSLFVMCACLAGLDNLLVAYGEAVKEDYDFGFFGDSMLIL
jgi:S-adenosylmethionine:tRNA ribosyltransferase-isomerase